MKTTDRYRVKAEKIHSLKDIALEKQRLQVEILKKEQDIHNGFRNIAEALTFRNLASTVVNEVAASSSVIAKAFSIGKSLMARRTKRKADKLKEVSDESGS